MKAKMRDARLELALKGKALMIAFEKAQPKNAAALKATGELIAPLPGDIADRSRELAGRIRGQMVQKLPSPPQKIKKFQKKQDNNRTGDQVRVDLSKQVLDYDIISLVQFVPDLLDREEVLDHGIIIALENNNSKLLRRIIAAGIDYKISGPLDYIIDNMNPTEHLNLLKNKMLATDPLEDGLLPDQFDSLAEKATTLKPAPQRKMLAEIAKIHPDKKPTKKSQPEEATQVKTKPQTAIEKRLFALRETLNAGQPGMRDDNEIALHFEIIESDLLPKIRQPALRSAAYQQLGTLSPDMEDQQRYYDQSIRITHDMKKGTSKTKRLKELRDDPHMDKERRMELHKAFVSNAALGELMTDGAEQKAMAAQVSASRGNKPFSSREDDPHMIAYKKYADLVPVTMEELTRRQKTMNITQQRVFDDHKAALGIT
jgi:hypothetical protein